MSSDTALQLTSPWARNRKFETTSLQRGVQCELDMLYRYPKAGVRYRETLLTKVLNELVVVTDHGGRRKVSKREAIITQLVNRSAKADFKAIQILLGMLRDIEADTDPHSADPTFTEADQQIIARIKRG